jgi:hypothetical protein
MAGADDFDPHPSRKVETERRRAQHRWRLDLDGPGIEAAALTPRSYPR